MVDVVPKRVSRLQNPSRGQNLWVLPSILVIGVNLSAPPSESESEFHRITRSMSGLVHSTKTVVVPSFTTDSGFNNEKVVGVILGLDSTESWIIRPEERTLEIGFESIRFIRVCSSIRSGKFLENW
jgi:hypothetical protein